MTITVDATKGWARPANASEWTELLSGTGLPNPDSAWPCTEASGNLADVIGSLTLTANGTPLYAQSATGWAGTGVAADDNTTDGFMAGAGVGPDPSTTSQFWLAVGALQTEPTAARVLIGIRTNSGVNNCRSLFNPAAGTNKLRIQIVGTTADGTLDHPAGDYVFGVMYDRAGSRAVAYSDLETVAGTYSASVADGGKGFGGSVTCGSLVVMYIAMWRGANAEGLDDADIATIRSRIESPPASAALVEDYRPSAGALQPRRIVPPLLSPHNDVLGDKNFGLEYEQRVDDRFRPVLIPRTLVPRLSVGWGDDEWVPFVATLDDVYRWDYRADPRLRLILRPQLGDVSDYLPMPSQAPPSPGASDTTTLSALAAGSTSGKWVVAIEGYQYLLTDATPTQATTAWTGSGFTSALHGLYVGSGFQPSQHLDPWAPFSCEGGNLTIEIAPDSGDTFGIDTVCRPSVETFLADDDTDCNDTNIGVLSTAGFAAPDVAYIGTEAFHHLAASSTAFTFVTRGLYPPFRTAQSGTLGFAHPHSIPTNPDNVQIPPVVSDKPRVWLGKWAGLWRHTFDTNTGLLNVRDNARCMFAGRLIEIEDTPNLTTKVTFEHVLQYVKRAVIGNDMWSGEFADGVWLFAGQRFALVDFNGTTAKTANVLTVVDTSPTSANEIRSGRRQIGEIMNALNAWTASELTAGRLNHAYSWSLHDTFTNGIKGHLDYTISGSGNACFWSMQMPKIVWRMFGTFGHSSDPAAEVKQISLSGLSVGADAIESLESARRFIANNGPNLIDLVNEKGTFQAQDETTLPAALAGTMSGYTNLGLIIIDGESTAIVSKTGTQFVHIVPWQNFGQNSLLFDPSFERLIDDPRGPVKVQQYFHYVAPFKTILKWLFYSTGTTGYNHAEFDVLPEAISLHIPGELLGSNFEDSCDRLPCADLEFPLIITKPTQIEKLLAGSLKLRFSFLRWKDEGLQFWSWMTPVTGDILSDSNKASPVGNVDEPRSTSRLVDDWQRNVIKIAFNRDFTLSDSNSYYSHTNVIDRVAISDAGGAARVETIEEPNSYSQWFLGGAGGVEQTIQHFTSIVPFFTRPVWRTRRTIDSRFFEGYAPGDVALLTDNYARDPDTGQRRISIRPAIIVDHRWTLGGASPNSDNADDCHGEVEVMLLDVQNVGAYVPTAQVDDTAASGGYNAGTKTLTCYAHKHSGGGEAADASYMSAGRKVRVVEIDPSDPAAPLSWDDVVVSQTGNTITLTTGLAGWDSTLHYRVIWDDYPDAIAAQQVFSYQADSADGKVSDLRVPFVYTHGTSNHTFPVLNGLTGTQADDPVELPPNSAYGDGVGVDVGTDVAIARLQNNLMDYKTGRCNPLVAAVASVAGDVDGFEWNLVYAFPINLGYDGLSTWVRRLLYVSPLCKSTDGTGLVRVTLARSMPADDSVENVDRGNIYGEAQFTAATSYSTPTPVGISIGKVKDASGLAYILIELKAVGVTETTSTYGLGSCYEGPRY